MKDKLGREIEYLRISLTERCNLRCKYCMPDWDAKRCSEESNEMSLDEIRELMQVLSPLGIKKVRLTGGEPLLRKDLEGIITEISKYQSINEICMTTNGKGLAERIESLKKAGLNRVNVSLDTLNPEEYAEITRGGAVSQVVEGIKKAQELGMKVKINCVLTDIQRWESIEKLAGWTVENDVDVRFIEIMPIGLGKEFQGITGEILLEKLKEKFEMENLKILEGTSRYYRIKGALGRIGTINPMSQCFCENCNKIRVTSNMELKTCLSSRRTFDLKKILHWGTRYEDRTDIVRKFIYEREEKNIFNENESEVKRMNQIGG